MHLTTICQHKALCHPRSRFCCNPFSAFNHSSV